MRYILIFYVVLFFATFTGFCLADYCDESYACTGTCYTSERYTTRCRGWRRCTRYRTKAYSCGKTCIRDVCCQHYTGNNCATPLCSGSTSCPNGGICVSPNYCSACNTGFASPACSDINECTSNNGDCEQVCTNTHGSYKCSCREGYALSSFTHCIDTNECSNGDSQCQHTCTNTLGSYTCSCNEGYSLAINTLDCEDIDECSAETPPCDHNCHNEVGTFSCSCTQGFELQIDGHTCTDFDECNNNNGGCEHVCNNIIGTYTCGCYTGYSLQTDGHTCIDIDECETSTSACQQTCTNTVGSYNCGCIVGYDLNVDNKACDDIDDCAHVECQNGGTCVDGIASYTCTCVTGFTGQHCQSDIDECSFLNGGCQDVCRNTNGAFACDCNGNRTLATNAASCIGEVTTASVFQRHQISRKILPRGCSTILLSTCSNDESHSVFLSSTSYWFSLKSNERISYSSGIVFAEVGSLSIPISLTGVTIEESDSTFSMSMTTNGYTATDGTRVGNERTADCLSFELTSNDLFDFISSNSFLQTLLTNLIPQLPEWMEFASADQSIIDTQDLRTDLVYGRDMDNTRWCEGAPVIFDHVYSVFRFGAEFSLSIYDNTINIPKLLDGNKFCIIIDICQNSGGSIFIMIPEESKTILTGLDFFKTLYEEQHILIYPRGFGFSIANGINTQYAKSELSLWNGDRLFTYPVFESGDMWMNAEFIYKTPDVDVQAQLAMFLDVKNVETALLGMYIDEWNLMVNLEAQATLRLNVTVFEKTVTLVLDDLVTASVDVYMSIGGTESRLVCGDVSNPPGIFLSAALTINPFKGVPVLEDWVFENTYEVLAFLTIDQDANLNSEITIDILNDVLGLHDRLANVDIEFQSVLQQFENILTNTTQSLISNIKLKFNDFLSTITGTIDSIQSGKILDVINVLKQLWSTVKQTKFQITHFFDEIEFNVDILSDNFTSFLNNEIEEIRSDISVAVSKLTNRVNTLTKSSQGFGLKFSATVHILGLKLFGLDIEFVNSVNSLGKCSRFDETFSLLKDEETLRILGRVSRERKVPEKLGYFLKFLKYEEGYGFGGAVAKHSKKWLFQITAFVNFLGIKAAGDVFLSSDEKLFLYLEANIWDIFYAQLDVTAELGEDWYKLIYKVEGRFVVNARRKRQTQTVATSYQGSYLDALKKVVQYIADEANRRIDQAKQIASFAQEVLSGAQKWLNAKKSQLQNSNSAFDNAVDVLESAKQSVEDAKGPYYVAIRKLDDAQRKVGNLCRIRSCPGICVPGIRWRTCRAGSGWASFKYPCPKFTSCMFRVPDLFCHAFNALCYAVRALAYLALEAAKIFIRIPMLVYDAAISALSVAQIAVDGSRIVLDITEGVFDLAVLSLEGAKLQLEVAKAALDTIKVVVGAAVKIVELVIDHGLKNILDVRNCGFSILLSTTDLYVFDISCEVNAFQLGWKTIRMKINFLNIGQSIWQAAKATINKIIDEFGSNLIGRKRREALNESSQKIHTLLRKLRESDQYQNVSNSITPEYNETSYIIDIIENTQGMDGTITSTFDQRVNLFYEKCKTILSIKSLFQGSFQSLFDSVSEIMAAKGEVLTAKDDLNKYNLNNVLDNTTLENSGISLDYAMNDYNLTEEELNKVLNDLKTTTSSNPLLVEIYNTIESLSTNIDDEMVSIEYFDILNQWINAMDNMTKDLFEESECVGYRDCVFHSISTLYDLFTYEDHPNVTEIQTSISILEDHILEIFSNNTYNVSTIYTHSSVIVTHIKLIFDLQMFCSTPPTIMTGLENETAILGSNTLMKCDVTFDPPPNYWWFKDDDLLIGENTKWLHFMNVTYQDEGIYKCVAGNIIGNVTSSDAFLSVMPITHPPGNAENKDHEKGILIGLLVAAGLVMSIVIAVIVIVYWRNRKRQLARSLQTKGGFVSSNMVRPDI